MQLQREVEPTTALATAAPQPLALERVAEDELAVLLLSTPLHARHAPNDVLGCLLDLVAPARRRLVLRILGLEVDAATRLLAQLSRLDRGSGSCRHLLFR